MAYPIEIMPRAVRDLEAVYAAIHAEESDAAFRRFRGLERALFTLEETPARCPVTPEDAHLGHLLYGKKPYVYRVIFEIDESHKVVQILTIRHGARQEFKTRELI
jgi:toxin ParE1/3/4